MSYTVTNKAGGHKKIWSVKECKVLLTFDKDNKAVVESKAVADKLKKLGYGVEEIKENKETKDKDSEEIKENKETNSKDDA